MRRNGCSLSYDTLASRRCAIHVVFEICNHFTVSWDNRLLGVDDRETDHQCVFVCPCIHDLIDVSSRDTNQTSSLAATLTSIKRSICTTYHLSGLLESKGLLGGG